MRLILAAVLATAAVPAVAQIIPTAPGQPGQPTAKVPAGTYAGVGDTETISVAAQWVTSAKQPDDLVYQITKTMWNDKTRALLDAGHAKGKTITLQNAVTSLGIPLHPGAERFYREAGALK